VFVRPSGSDFEVLVVTVDDEEATVIKATVDPKAVGSWMKELET
jgi:hypothetical protein